MAFYYKSFGYPIKRGRALIKAFGYHPTMTKAQGSIPDQLMWHL